MTRTGASTDPTILRPDFAPSGRIEALALDGAVVVMGHNRGFEAMPWNSPSRLGFRIQPLSEEIFTNQRGSTLAIVTLDGGHPVTTSLAIAQGIDNQHEAVIRLVRAYRSDLEEFGPLRFEIQVVNRPQGGGSQSEYAVLNEQQATLLITYMRNSEIVHVFKKALVKAFYEVKAPKVQSTAELALLMAKNMVTLERQIAAASRQNLAIQTKIGALEECSQVWDFRPQNCSAITGIRNFGSLQFVCLYRQSSDAPVLVQSGAGRIVKQNTNRLFSEHDTFLNGACAQFKKVFEIVHE